nr:hypothetical protein [Kibdelosporangium phytohabitans]
MAWSRKAHAHIDLEQAEAAEAACDRAVELAPRADDPRSPLAAVVSTRSTAHLRGGDKLGADDDVEKGYQLDVERHSPMWVIDLRLRRSALIKLALERREFAVADAYAAIALTRRDPRRRRELARCYMVAAEVQLGIDMPAEAIPLLTNALNIYSEQPKAIHEGETHELLERAYAQIGRSDRAVEHNRKAFSLSTQCGQPRKAEVVAMRLRNYPG